MTNLVKINPSEYGLTETKAQEIELMFKPMLEKMAELEQEYNQIAQSEISPAVCKQAKDLRQKYVKVRTGTAAIHKELKAFYLNGGRFVDGWKSAQLFASQGIEDKLEAIENHFITLERERIAQLEQDRITLLQPYSDIMPQSLGLMDENVFQNYLTGAKVAHEARIAAERKAEAERIEAERVAALDRVRRDKCIRLVTFIDNYDSIAFGVLSDNEFMGIVNAAIEKRTEHEAEQQRLRYDAERLRKEAEEKEAALAAERKAQAEALEQQRKEAEAKQKAIEDAARAERQAAEAEAARLRAEIEKQKEAERKAQAEAAQAEADRKAAEAKAAKAPIKDKLSAWVNSLPAPPDGSDTIAEKFAAFKAWTLAQINAM